MMYVLYALVALIVALIIRRTFRTVTVFEYQSGLRYSKGRLVGVVSPGRYTIFAPSTTMQLVDTRETFATITGQELISSDGVTVRLSLFARYQVADPKKALGEVDDFPSALYLLVQTAARSILGGMTIDEVLEKRNELGPLVAESAIPQVEGIGLKLHSVDIKDIMLPGEVKKLFNQIVKARKEGLASLERARGETATLRNLANAAKMMADNPALMQLRILQQMTESSGNTFVISLPQDGTIVPVGKGSDAGPSEGPESI